MTEPSAIVPVDRERLKSAIRYARESWICSHGVKGLGVDASIADAVLAMAPAPAVSAGPPPMTPTNPEADERLIMASPKAKRAIEAAEKAAAFLAWADEPSLAEKVRALMRSHSAITQTASRLHRDNTELRQRLIALNANGGA